jgi:hypothetical protein
MKSITASRAFAAAAPWTRFSPSSSSASLAQKRCYATAKPKTPPPPSKATKTASSYAKSRSSATKMGGGGGGGAEPSIASSTPLRKPSTTGLGVPSKSPSSSPRATTASTSPGATTTRVSPPLGGNNTSTSTISQASAAQGDAAAAAAAAVRAAAAREAKLRAARDRRIDRTAEEEAKKAGEAAYKKRYRGAAWRWTRTMIALPVLLVTSWYLFDRCEYLFLSFFLSLFALFRLICPPLMEDLVGD